MKRKCKSGSEKRKDKKRTIKKAKQNTAPIASFFEKAKNVGSDAEGNPPARHLHFRS